MRHNLKLFLLYYIPVMLLFLSATIKAQQPSVGLALGSKGGAGFELNAAVDKLAQGFPFILRLGMGYAGSEAGDAAAARKIFINNATNGIPEEKGRVLDLRLDFLHRVDWFGWKRLYAVAGPRLSWFRANFKYIGGNEDFDVRSKQWGIGFGLEKYFAMTPHLDLMLSAGLDYFARSKLQGHDTSYSPNGETVNGREDYTFEDADKAINQPFVEPRAMLGITYTF